MATVTLTKVFVHDRADFDDYVAYQSAGRADGRSADGEIRTYATGRRRIVTTPARARRLPYTLRMVDDAGVDWLDDHKGVAVMVRDHVGNVEFGTYFALDVVPYKDGSGSDVSFAFESYTDTVEV